MSKDIKESENIDEEIDMEGDSDIVFESEEDQNGAHTIKKLRERLKQTSAEKQEYLEGWQRSKADFVNAKRDFDEEKIKLLKFAKADLIIQLIPVLDSFEMAFNSDHVDKSDLLKEWLVGVQYIYSQFLLILKDNGVEQLDPLGNVFDPKFHTSLEVVEVDKEQKDGIIIEVIQKGYSLNGEIIRPAKVKVGEFKK